MKNLFTKIVIAVFAFCFMNAVQASTLITNITANGTYRLFSSGTTITGFKFYSTSPATLLFYDETTMTAPYYGTNQVLASYVSASSTIATNVTGPYVGPSGYTNYMTNIVLSTSYTTNAAATNQAAKVYSVYIPASTYLNVEADILTTKGLVVYGNPATNVSVTIDYKVP